MKIGDERNVARTDKPTLDIDTGSRDNGPELTNIAWPRECNKFLHSLRRKFASSAASQPAEMLSQERYVFFSVPQRRNEYDEVRYPKKEIGPKLTLLSHVDRILARRTHEPKIGFLGPFGTQRVVFACLDNPQQFWLSTLRHAPNLIKKERAA